MFQNIGVYHEKFAKLMKQEYQPYVELGISADKHYTYGCQVESLDHLPDGLLGFDTTISRFTCFTFRVQPGDVFLCAA
jgi:hypothetical protein